MTSAADVALAVDAGADAVGVIVAESSRRVSLDRLAAIAAAIPPYVSRVGVLADQGESEAAPLRALGFTLQFSGEETPEQCAALAAGLPYLKVFHLDPSVPNVEVERYAAYENAVWMFDTHVAGNRGGTGRAFDWSALEAIASAHRIVVSGGLRAENVGACVALVRPFAVDVRSGIETDGAKDPVKMAAFVRSVCTA
jgi:phosphoribosylanthranilate isomerase